MRSMRRAAFLSRTFGLSARGTAGLWVLLAAVGLIARLGRHEQERVLRRTLRRGDALLVRVAEPGSDRPPDARRLV